MTSKGTRLCLGTYHGRVQVLCACACACACALYMHMHICIVHVHVHVHVLVLVFKNGKNNSSGSRMCNPGFHHVLHLQCINHLDYTAATRRWVGVEPSRVISYMYILTKGWEGQACESKWPQISGHQQILYTYCTCTWKVYSISTANNKYSVVADGWRKQPIDHTEVGHGSLKSVMKQTVWGSVYMHVSVASVEWHRTFAGDFRHSPMAC